MIDHATIAAVATPPGRGGVAIIRISGAEAAQIGEQLTGRKLAPPRQAMYGSFRDANSEIIDRGLVIQFAPPASYTGEQIVEIHGHGGSVVLSMLLERVLQLGARMARPGEFTERAFLNGKMDLAQAEAVADLIDSGSVVAVKSANRSLAGEFSKKTELLQSLLSEARMHIEAAIDFPEEEIDFLADPALKRRLEALDSNLSTLLKKASAGRLLRDGLNVVLAGPPNVGKSSLMNRLSGDEVSIVTAQPGTTRDLIREQINIDGIAIHLTDTAGLRDTSDEIESEGIKRTRSEVARADHMLYLLDASQVDADRLRVPDQGDTPVTVIMNKIDLSGEVPQKIRVSGHDLIYISAKHDAGLDLLKSHLIDTATAGMGAELEGTFSARQRHIDILRRVQVHLSTGMHELTEHGAGEIMAEELRQAQSELAQITGEHSSDDLLGEIFSGFCIGK